VKFWKTAEKQEKYRKSKRFFYKTRLSKRFPAHHTDGRVSFSLRIVKSNVKGKFRIAD
jgi:hypothetical protein